MGGQTGPSCGPPVPWPWGHSPLALALGPQSPDGMGLEVFALALAALQLALYAGLIGGYSDTHKHLQTGFFLLSVFKHTSLGNGISNTTHLHKSTQ